MLKSLLNLFYFSVDALFILMVFSAGAIIHFNNNLPDYRSLKTYTPLVTSQIYAANGALLKEFSEERRLYIPEHEIPDIVKKAFISIEDASFYSHFGIDVKGVMRAVRSNLARRALLQGGSTITQQVVKNTLLSNEKTFTRKIREALLSIKIDKNLSKKRVLEIYLNEIYLGSGSYGVGDASLNYFNKPLAELEVEEAALLAAMPKAPSFYNPRKNYKKALLRRNMVLRALYRENYISKREYNVARKKPINLKIRKKAIASDSGFFLQEIVKKAKNLFGKNTLKKDGIAIYTSLHPEMQKMAEKALRNGLEEYDHRYGYRGAIDSIKLDENWPKKLQEINRWQVEHDFQNIEKAVILQKHSDDEIIEIGLANGETSYIIYESLKWAFTKFIARNNRKNLGIDNFSIGDVIFVRKTHSNLNPYELFQVPEINGAIIVMEVASGRILAMSGGYSFQQSNFNRATMAKRQVGSILKPFIYLTAFENGYSPSDLIADEPIDFDNFGDEKTWSPRNHNGLFYGVTTLRKGLEKSINVMTVHLTKLLTIDKALESLKKYGIYDRPKRNMATILGAQESTLLAITSAYAAIANGGKIVKPRMIDEVYDRNNEFIYSPKKAAEKGEIDEIANYQIISLLEGVIKNGTAKNAQEIGKIIAGKTGTTNNSMDSWFVGFTPEIVVGVYAGFDRPKSLGASEEGSTIALPIFVDFMKNALKDKPSVAFKLPKNIRMVKIDSKTGFLPSDETPKNEIIIEFFKIGKEPLRSVSRKDVLNTINQSQSLKPDNDALDFGNTGIY